MKELVVKYLKDRYFKKCEGDNPNGEDTTDENDATARNGKHPQAIEDNINSLKRLVDSQTKELAKLNKIIESLVK